MHVVLDDTNHIVKNFSSINDEIQQVSKNKFTPTEVDSPLKSTVRLISQQLLQIINS